MRDQVKEYYGKILKRSKDLKTNACCAGTNYPPHIKSVMADIHDEIHNRFYGCGLVTPTLLKGLRVLDLGSGAGRDCFVFSKLVGADGYVLGVDMTSEQLAVANKYIGYHTKKFGYEKPNIEFKQGYIEGLDELNLEDNSFDIIVSNCVINLSPDKESVIRGAYRLLKPGGELYFSDVYADRRIDPKLKDDPILYGECLSGALYWNDFLHLARKCGFNDPRLVEDSHITVDNEEIQKKIAPVNFYSATYRLFKIPALEPDCEDYGQSVIYKGTVPQQESEFVLDKEHTIKKRKRFAVCGNTYRILKESRYAPHFEFFGNWSIHLGIFDCCGQSLPFEDKACNPASGCCCQEVEATSTESDQTAKIVDNELDKKSLPGYIQPHALKELWFHTGTVCNLSCSFCFEDSKPGDNRLERITFDDAKPLIDEARVLGVKKFSFTGGEPFVVKDMMKILDYALEHRPCMVLTNGTKPLSQRLADLRLFLKKPHPLAFRVSIDHADEAKHDMGRGKGNFRLTIYTLKELHKLGFKISIARQFVKDEDTTAIEGCYRELFQKMELPGDTNIVAFPDLLKPGLKPNMTKISEDCMTRYHSQESRREFMCAYSKMVIKQNGKTRVYACTLVDDDKDYDLGSTLTEGMEKRVNLSHHRCMGCFSAGVSCSEG